MRSIGAGEAKLYTGTSSYSNRRADPAIGARGRLRRANAPLWIVQAMLAVIFLFAGSMKLVLPPEVLTAQLPFPGWFLRFVGVAELLGAAGLILPGLLRIRPRLTSLAAAGLVIVMIGATILTLAVSGVASALVPLVVGLLAALVAYGRWSAISVVS
jgi:uncharacterized membrane protein YphA (DoxX/SURF4 family)